MENVSAKLRRRDLLVQRLHSARLKLTSANDLTPAAATEVHSVSASSPTIATIPCCRIPEASPERLALEIELSLHRRYLYSQYRFYYQWCVWIPDPNGLDRIERTLQTPTETKALMIQLKQRQWQKVTVFRMGSVPLRKYHKEGGTLEFKFAKYHTALQAFRVLTEALVTNEIYGLCTGLAAGTKDQAAVTGITLKLQPSYFIVRIWYTPETLAVYSISVWLSIILHDSWDGCVQVSNCDQSQIILV